MVNLLTIPSFFRNFTCFSGPKDLVKMFAVWSSVGQYYSSIVPYSTSCLMKWQCVSTCLVCSWKTGFLASFITPWLSQNKGVGSLCCICISDNILLSQTASHAPFNAPRYSTSVDERATTCCFLLVHVTAPVPRLKTYPEVDFLSSTEPAQSESVYPHNLGYLLLLYKIPNSSVPFTYLSTHFVVV